MYNRPTPESVGVSSKKILKLIKNLEECKFHTHSILIAKGNDVIAETYYKPFHKDFLHRMYSVSKTFVAVAVGLAVTEGIMSLDDIVIDYFPEFRNDKTDEYYDECTVRDMLCMKSNFGGLISWWGRYQSRVEAYYDQGTTKIADTLYFYDSIGSFLLGCIIEKLTGKTFLEYLKDGILLDMGFSKESYTLKEPGGYTIGDSGVMCTTRDLAILARFIMQKGRHNGKQYIEPKFMEDMISNQSYNNLNGGFDSYTRRGYGYLTWITHDTGFSLVGAGDQLAICDMKKDLLFVITSDNQIDNASGHIIFREVCKYFLPHIKNKPIYENEEAFNEMQNYLQSRELICQEGLKTTAISDDINGAEYIAMDNPQGISKFRLILNSEDGCLELTKDGHMRKIPFGICKNTLCTFSFGDRPVLDMMGKNEVGEYECASSSAWVDEYTFAIKLQVIDTYFGGLYILISFKDSRATMHLSKSGQYVFDGIGGYVICHKNTTERKI